MGATTAWHLLAARLALRMQRCNRVQPKLFRKFLIVIGKKSGLQQNPLSLGAFASEVGRSCSEKKQKTFVWA